MTSWAGAWDEVSFIGFLEREKVDIARRLCTGSLAARDAAAAESEELHKFITLILKIKSPGDGLRDVDLVIDPAVQLKSVSHGAYKAYYLVFPAKSLFYGAVVVRGDESGLIARLTEISATLSEPVPSAGPAAEGDKS